MQKQPFNWFYGLDRFNDPNLNDNTRNPLLSHYVGLFLTSLFFNCCYLLAFGHAKIDEVQLKTIPGSNAHHFFMGCTKDEEFFPSGKRRSIPRFTYDEWAEVKWYFDQYWKLLTYNQKLERCGHQDFVVELLDIFAKYVIEIYPNKNDGGRVFEIPTPLAQELTSAFNRKAAKIYGNWEDIFVLSASRPRAGKSANTTT